MKTLNLSKLFLLLISLFWLSSCGNDDDNGRTTVTPTLDTEDERLFVWNAMNSWYYFQEDIPNLSDSKDDNPATFSAFLNDFQSVDNLFNSLLYFPETVDKYSKLVDDYEELGGGLSAIYNDFGFDYGLVLFNETDILGYVRYVSTGSQAEAAGLTRGDIFLEVDGTQLTIANYVNLLNTDGQINLGMAELESNTLTLTGEEIAITTEVFEDRNPIETTEIINLPGGVTLGYLHYTNFAYNFHAELNEVFSEFKAAGVNELALDLRYNPGGTVLTATYLNSMIYSTNTNLLMGTLDYNAKHSDFNSNIRFANTLDIKDDDFETIGTEQIHSLGLSRVYVFVSSSTASASEFVINCLSPYMDVIVIGSQTEGKNLGSISLYDTPDDDYTEEPTGNPSHTYGMQLIVSKVANSLGESDYDDGIVPDVEISEIDYLDNLQPLGSENEVMLNYVIQDLCPTCRVAPTNLLPIDINQQYFGERNMFQPNYQVLDISGLQ